MLFGTQEVEQVFDNWNFFLFRDTLNVCSFMVN